MRFAGLLSPDVSFARFPTLRARLLVVAAAAAIVVAAGALEPAAQQPQPSISTRRHSPTLQRRMETGQDTARSLAEKYLARIEALDRRGPALRSIIEINPDALTIADQLDAERQDRGPRGPLHGIPIVIKDNIATADRMMTTAGSLALVGVKPPQEAFVVDAPARGGRRHPRQDEPERVGELPLDRIDERLERARRPDPESVRARSQSVRLELGLGGRRRPRTSPRRRSEPRPTARSFRRRRPIRSSASSRRSASSAGPASSRSRIRRTPPGPMARTVADAAALLDAMAAPDPDDAATDRAASRRLHAVARRQWLKGSPHRRRSQASVRQQRRVDRIAEAAIADMKARGAVIVDPADIPTLGTFDDAELDVLLYEFKADVNKYLARSDRPRRCIR